MPLPRSGDDPSLLIVLTGSLGDVARALPLAALFSRAHPSGRLSWVVERRWAPLVRLNRHVHRVVEFDRSAGWPAILRLLRDLRQCRYDVAIDLQRILKSGLIALASRAPRRVGFHPDDAKEGSALLANDHVPARGESVSKLRHYLTFAHHLGWPVGEPLDFGLDPVQIDAHLPAALADRTGRVLAIAVGSSWPSKDWPEAQWRRLCAMVLARTSLDVVLVGRDPGPAMGWPGRSEPASPALDSDRIVDLRGRTSLVELVAVIRRAALAVGPDTGTGHVAAAVGTRYIGLYGPTDPRRVAPWGSEQLAIDHHGACHGCRRRCRRPEDWCMAGIAAEQVWARASEVLSDPSAATARTRWPAAIPPPASPS